MNVVGASRMRSVTRAAAARNTAGEGARPSGAPWCSARWYTSKLPRSASVSRRRRSSYTSPGVLPGAASIQSKSPNASSCCASGAAGCVDITSVPPVVGCAGSDVLPGHDRGHAGRLGRALDLEGDRLPELYPARDVADLVDDGPGPEPAAHGHRRGEAHLLRAVVDAHREAGVPGQLRQEPRDERQRQVAVCDRPAEQALPARPLDVDVDPLVITGGLGEQVDHVLGD